MSIAKLPPAYSVRHWAEIRREEEVSLADADLRVDMARDRLAIAVRDVRMAAGAGVLAGISALTGGGVIVAGLAVGFTAKRSLEKQRAEAELSAAESARSELVNSLKHDAPAHSIVDNGGAHVADEALAEWQEVVVEAEGSVEVWAMRTVAKVERFEGVAGPTIAPSFLDGLAKAGPRVAEAVRSGATFELLGPGAVLEGLRNGTLEMIPAKSGGVLGGIRAVGDGSVLHQARFGLRDAVSAAAPGLAMAVASAVLGHMHMIEIRRSVVAIEGRVAAVQDGQRSRRFGKVRGSVHALSEIVEDVAGGCTVDDPLRVRLDRVGDELAAAAEELAKQHQTYAINGERLSAAGLGELSQYLSQARPFEVDDAWLLIHARAGLVVVKRLRLEIARKSGHDVNAAEGRLAQAIDGLRQVEQDLGYMAKAHDRCRAVLEEERGSSLRMRTGPTEEVSQRLREGRVIVAELFELLRGQVSAVDSAPSLRAIRIDASGKEPSAEVVMLLTDA